MLRSLLGRATCSGFPNDPSPPLLFSRERRNVRNSKFQIHHNLTNVRGQTQCLVNQTSISESDMPTPGTRDQNVIEPSWPGRPVCPHHDNDQHVDCKLMGSDTRERREATPPSNEEEKREIEMGTAGLPFTSTDHSPDKKYVMTDSTVNQYPIPNHILESDIKMGGGNRSKSCETPSNRWWEI